MGHGLGNTVERDVPRRRHNIRPVRRERARKTGANQQFQGLKAGRIPVAARESAGHPRGQHAQQERAHEVDRQRRPGQEETAHGGGLRRLVQARARSRARDAAHENRQPVGDPHVCHASHCTRLEARGPGMFHA